MIFSGGWPLHKRAVNVLLSNELCYRGHKSALRLFWANLLVHHPDTSLLALAAVCVFVGLHPMVHRGYSNVIALEQ